MIWQYNRPILIANSFCFVHFLKQMKMSKLQWLAEIIFSKAESLIVVLSLILCLLGEWNSVGGANSLKCWKVPLTIPWRSWEGSRLTLCQNTCSEEMLGSCLNCNTCLWLQETDLQAVVHYFMVVGLFQVCFRKFMEELYFWNDLKDQLQADVGFLDM